MWRDEGDADGNPVISGKRSPQDAEETVLSTVISQTKLHQV